MKAQIRVSPNLMIHVEGEKQKDLFKELAQAQEVFGEQECGLCGNKQIRFVVRTVGKHSFHEYHCENHQCRARLTLGAHDGDGGTLFPNRKLLENGEPATGNKRSEGKFGPHRGWTKYKGEKK